MIVGKVKTGAGQAELIREEVFQARCKAAGVSLVRGTLNVHVADLDGAVVALGTWDFETDRDDCKLGPLRWWHVWVSGNELPAQGVRAFIVRHERTKTKYLEVMSEVYFRELGLGDEHEVRIELKKWNNRIRRT